MRYFVVTYFKKTFAPNEVGKFFVLTITGRLPDSTANVQILTFWNTWTFIFALSINRLWEFHSPLCASSAHFSYIWAHKPCSAGWLALASSLFRWGFPSVFHVIFAFGNKTVQKPSRLINTLWPSKHTHKRATRVESKRRRRRPLTNPFFFPPPTLVVIVGSGTGEAARTFFGVPNQPHVHWPFSGTIIPMTVQQVVKVMRAFWASPKLSLIGPHAGKSDDRGVLYRGRHMRHPPKIPSKQRTGHLSPIR